MILQGIAGSGFSDPAFRTVLLVLFMGSLAINTS